ncbi:MAG: hypothetical protein AAGJ94_01895, partial [Pseudomonadota bacterium]
MRRRSFLWPLLAVVFALGLAPAASAQTPQDTDYMKRAGNFFANCDARTGADGERPPVNYVCLAFIAGLVEGYTTAAVANGNPRPYCLPRPTSLVELSDMMTTVMERGVQPDLPTATVFHFILEANFPCAPATASSDAPAATASPGAGVETAQSTTPAANEEPLLPVTDPATLDAQEGTLPVTPPSVLDASEGTLPVVTPSTAPGIDDRTRIPTTPDPANPGSTTPEASAPDDTPATAPAAAGRVEESEPPAPLNRPGTAIGPVSAEGPESALGPSSAIGPGTATGPASTPGPGSELAPETAEGPVTLPLNRTPTTFGAPVIQVDPLVEPPDDPAAPVVPARPARPQTP